MRGYIVFSVFDYKTLAVSATFKASGLAWYDAGLLSVQRDGAITAFLCAARENCKSSPVMVQARRVAFREDESLWFNLQKPSEQYICHSFPFCPRASISFVINVIQQRKDFAICCFLFLLIVLSVHIYLI